MPARVLGVWLVSFLACPPQQDEEIVRWVEQLGATGPEEREEAVAKLKAAEEKALKALEAAGHRKDSEVAARTISTMNGPASELESARVS
jgi:hypothetical protein